MKIRLQMFGFDQSAYERPNQKWVCGWASEGTPCHRGPDEKGRCCGGFACQPIRSDSRWVCTRSTSAGGPCPKGPLPDGSCCQSIVTCRPVRSLRARRGLVAAWTFALMTGILLLGIARWPRFFSPGPVARVHAPLLATATGCATCHTAPHDWMTALDRDRTADSTKCLQCHQSQPHFHETSLAMLAHGVPASLLNAVRKTPSGPAAASDVPLESFPASGPTGEIACATCHHEHRGADIKLAAMDNQTCQACHAVKFQSFKEGHPDFHQHHEAANHPIVFSHATHRDQHFGSAKFECASCHTPAPDGRIRTASFESSCARCHSDHFNGKAEPSKSGIVVLQIPALDLQTLSTLKVDIGQWPKYDGDPPVRLNPFLRLLLGGKQSEYLAHLPPDLGQLSDASDEQIAAVQQLAWSIKNLLGAASKDVNALRPVLSAGVHVVARTVAGDSLFPSPGTPAFGSEAQARRGEGQGGGPAGTDGLGLMSPAPPPPQPSPGVPGEGANAVSPAAVPVSPTGVLGEGVNATAPLVSNGPSRRFSALSDAEFAELTAGLSTEDVKTAADRWFPQLATEIQKPFERWNPGKRPHKAADVAPPKPGENKPSAPPSDDLFNDTAPAPKAPHSAAPATNSPIRLAGGSPNAEVAAIETSWHGRLARAGDVERKKDVDDPAFATSFPANTGGTPVPLPRISKVVCDRGTAAKPAAPAGKSSDDDLFNGDVAPVKPAPPTARKPAAAVPAGDDLFNGDVAPAKPANNPAASAATKPAAAPSAGDDLFNGDVTPAKPAEHQATPTVGKPAPAAGGDDLFNGDSAAAPTSKPAVATPSTLAVAEQAASPAPSGPALSPSGWERDDEKFALVYHPTGHANLFLRRWLEVIAPQQSNSTDAWRTQLLSAEVGGACVKCHASAGSGTLFAWSLDSADVRRDFVKFSHSPHLLEPRLQNCTACHALPQPSDAHASVDPVSGFKLIQKQSCSACHAPRLASDSCLTCHNYHVTPPATLVSEAKQ